MAVTFLLKEDLRLLLCCLFNCVFATCECLYLFFFSPNIPNYLSVETTQTFNNAQAFSKIACLLKSSHQTSKLIMLYKFVLAIFQHSCILCQYTDCSLVFLLFFSVNSNPGYPVCQTGGALCAMSSPSCRNSYDFLSVLNSWVQRGVVN